MTIGTRLLVDTLQAGLGETVPQVGEPTYAAKIDPAELQIDWTRTPVEVHRLVRLGRAWTTFRGRRLRLLRTVLDATAPADPAPVGTLEGAFVAAGDGWLRVLSVQPEGRGPQPLEAWRNGARPAPGERLGT